MAFELFAFSAESAILPSARCRREILFSQRRAFGVYTVPRITSYNVCYTKLLRVRAVNLHYEAGVAHFDILLQTEGQVIEGCTLPMPGDHNVSNALAAVAVARHLGMRRGEIRDALAKFGGVNRRFTRVGEWNGAPIIDSYNFV